MEGFFTLSDSCLKVEALTEVCELNEVAVFLVDVQRDFCAGGALAVPDGDAVVPVCNTLLKLAEEKGIPVFASRDWHPSDHCSFAPQGGPWPVHCVAGQPGAEFHPDLKLTSATQIVSKAESQNADAYSAFDGTHVTETLRSAGVKHLVVCGLATDYCVKATVLDALKEGFRVTVIKEGCRGVNVAPGDDIKAFDEMKSSGAQVCSLTSCVL